MFLCGLINGSDFWLKAQLPLASELSEWRYQGLTNGSDDDSNV